MLLNHIGCKKNGFTLIELIISIAIDLVILSICFSILTVNYKNFKFLISDNRVNSSIDDAILNINIFLKTKMIENIKFNDDDNTIIVSYREKHSKETIKIKKIFLNKYNKIAIKTLDEFNKDDNKDNPILMDVESFDVIKKDKIYYLKIKMINGDQRVICL